MKKLILSAVLSLTFALSPLFAVESINIIDTPAASSLGRGLYTIGAYLYSEGGVYTRTIIGVTDGLMLGLNTSIDSVIGMEEPRIHVPGIFAKWRFMNFGIDSWQMAVGFAAQSFSDVGYRYEKPVHGAFFVVQKGLLFGKRFRFNPQFYGGVRYPLLPAEYREEHIVNFYGGASCYFGEHFELKLELANITWFEGEHEVFNTALAYHFSEMFSIELDTQITKIDDEIKFNRMIKLDMINLFY